MTMRKKPDIKPPLTIEELAKRKQPFISGAKTEDYVKRVL